MQKHPKLSPLVLILLLLIITASCQQQMVEETTGPVRPALAVVLPGSQEDSSWSAAAYRALQQEAALGAKTAWREGVTDAEVASVLQDYVNQGFKIIVAHSYSYQDAVFDLAPKHPDVYFAWAGGIGRTGPNVADYDQPFYEAGYLVGILAGSLSPSGNLGALYGFDIPPCHALGEAFLAGARTVNPLVRLAVSETGAWDDVAAATAAGLAQAQQQRVDFWIACGEGPTLGSIAAAQATGGLATGYASDMTQVAPAVVLASMVWQMTPLFDALAQATTAGSFAGTFYRFGLQARALDVVINPALQSHIPPVTQQAFAQARLAMQAGRLQAPYIPR